jgi:DNA-binding MarR family transcriptional regulator
MAEDKNFILISKMLKICRTHRALIDSGVGEMGIPSSAHRALMYISRHGRLESQKELAAYLEITPAAVTGVLKRLESDGYIERTLGADNRFNEISITEKGSATVEQSREMFKKIDGELTVGLTDEEIGAFVSTLDKIKFNADKFIKAKGEKNEKMV